MILQDCNEIVGTLEKYTEEKDILKLVIKIQHIINIPFNAISKEELDNCLNKKIGIINIDENYKLRKIIYNKEG